VIQTKQKSVAIEQRNKYKPRTERGTTPSKQTPAGWRILSSLYRKVFQNAFASKLRTLFRIFTPVTVLVLHVHFSNTGLKYFEFVISFKNRDGL
jgi:predicted helicase